MNHLRLWIARAILWIRGFFAVRDLIEIACAHCNAELDMVIGTKEKEEPVERVYFGSGAIVRKRVGVVMVCTSCFGRTKVTRLGVKALPRRGEPAPELGRDRRPTIQPARPTFERKTPGI